MSLTAYNLVTVVHFSNKSSNYAGDVDGFIGDVLIVDSVANTGTVYTAGVMNGSSFPFTLAQATALVTAGWLSADTSFSGVPASKAPGTGWTAVTGWTALAKQAFTSATSATLLQVSEALAALISDLTAMGHIGQ